MRLEPEVAFAQLLRVDARPIPEGAGEIRAFLVVRDEELRLPHVLAHHRALGVDRFFVVDNASRDGTSALLRAQGDVHLWTTAAPYGDANFGFDWSAALLHRHGRGHWCLLLDGDEQLVYPHLEALPLRGLLRALEAEGAEAAAALVLDMYGQGPVVETGVPPGGTLLDACPWFDRDGYEVVEAPGRVPPFMVFGGPRARLFWSHLEASQRAVDAWIDEGRGGPPPAWNEVDYLAAHPDVADGVAAGAMESGFAHYVRHGRAEGRALTADGPPCLTNVPLVRWSEELRYENGRHAFEGPRLPRLSAVRVALLHFRLMADLDARARLGIEGATPGPGAASYSALDAWRREHQAYLRGLERDPRAAARSGRAERYLGSAQLTALGLLASSPELEAEASR